MTLRNRLLTVFIPLVLLPILLLMAIQFFLTRNYLIASNDELLLFENQVLFEELNNRYQQIEAVQFNTVPFFQRQILSSIASRYTIDEPLAKGMLFFDDQGRLLYPEEINGVRQWDSLTTQTISSALNGNVIRMNGTFIGNPGQEYAVASFYHAPSNWYAVLYDNQQSVLAPLTQSTSISILFAFAVLVIAVLIILLAARRISQPIVQLTEAVNRFGEQGAGIRVQETHGGEVGILSKEFNRMTERIDSLTQFLEARIHERTQELQDRVSQLHATQTQLVESEKLASLGSMVAGVAHELNTPIGNAITASSCIVEARKRLSEIEKQGLTRQALDQFIADIEEASFIVDRSLIRAAELIGSFKRLAVDQTSYQRRTFELAEVMHEIVITMRSFLRTTPHKLVDKVHVSAEFDSYPGPLGQVLMNLINNAIVHAFDTHQTGEITITTHQDSPNWMTIEVSDNGKGIPETSLKRIFDPFYTTKMGKGGSGLGLHITYTLITGLMGGNIRVESHVGKGSTFFITVPLQAPRTHPENND